MNKTLAILRPALLLIAIVLLGGCQSAPTNTRETAAADQEIEDQQALWLKAYNAKDAAGLTAIYADDAWLMPPDTMTVAGDIAIQNYWTAFFAQSTASMLRSAPDTTVMGNYAFSSVAYTLLDAKGAILDRGKYLEIWKQEGQNWKLYRDMYSSSQPPHAANTAAPGAGTTSAPAAATH